MYFLKNKLKTYAAVLVVFVVYAGAVYIDQTSEEQSKPSANYSQ